MNILMVTNSTAGQAAAGMVQRLLAGRQIDANLAALADTSAKQVAVVAPGAVAVYCSDRDSPEQITELAAFVAELRSAGYENTIIGVGPVRVINGLVASGVNWVVGPYQAGQALLKLAGVRAAH